MYCIQERQEIARELEERRKQEESRSRKVCVWQLAVDANNVLKIDKAIATGKNGINLKLELDLKKIDISS